jgi:hypothetical protein
MTNNSNVYFFGQVAIYDAGNPEEETEALKFLESWKKFTMRNLETDCYRVRLKEEQYHTRPPEFISAMGNRASISLKICVEIEFKLMGQL